VTPSFDLIRTVYELIAAPFVIGSVHCIVIASGLNEVSGVAGLSGLSAV